MNITVMMVAVFASVSLGIVGTSALIYEYFFSRQVTNAFTRRRRILRRCAASAFDSRHCFSDLQQLSTESEAKTESLSMKMQTIIDQSGLEWTLNHVFVGMIMSSLVVAFVSVMLLGARFSFPGLILGAFVPPLYIFNARSKRMASLTDAVAGSI